ncbi:hypothetical protein PENSPDRAFT_670448 [Peniophora sp. CONT]|nr:hypothetical protein PENSPDRAFT_670448 [Peniophora sp. CONT]
MEPPTADDEDPQWEDEVTYGDCAADHISSNHITAAQHAVLEPLIGKYVTLDGAEKVAFVQTAFQTVWDGGQIDWDLPNTWPSKAKNPRFHALRNVLMVAKAVRNFFSERGRIRDVVVKLPRASSGVWTPLAVCSEVYKNAVNDLVEQVSGCKPGTRGGWISEYPKGRRAFYRRLSEEQRAELDRIAKQWNRTGTPKSAKLKKYKRSGKRLLRNIALQCLKQYGVYVFFLVVAEPGLEIETELVDFSTDLGLDATGFKDDTVLVNTISRLDAYVRSKAGTLEVREKKKKGKKKSSALEAPVGFRFEPQDYRNRNSVAVRREAFDPKLLYKESINNLYHLFAYAHCNIAGEDPSTLEPPWTAMAEPDHLIDPKYFPSGPKYPDGFKMENPRGMKKDKRKDLLDHLLKLGELEFHHWKPRNVDRQEPVPFDERFWAVQPGQRGSEAFEAAKALAAKPSRYEGARSHLQPSAEAGPMTRSDRAMSSTSVGVESRPAPSPSITSPYGSNRVADVHDISHWQESNFAYPPRFTVIPDPDDRLPIAADPNNLHAPCSVPENAEARAQWCFLQAMTPAREGKLPTTLFKACVTIVCELPLIHNYFYDPKNFRKSRKAPYIPPSVTWSSSTTNAVQQTGDSHATLTFLTGTPWTYEHKGEERFSGVQMAWLILLAVIMYTECEFDSESDMHTVVTTVLRAFRDYLRHIARQCEYPGTPPSLKYGVASSRQGYLYSIFQYEETLVELLQYVQRLPADTEPLDRHVDWGERVPSWQSPRLGLPPHMHNADHTAFFTKWLARGDRFCNEDTGLLVSREKGLEYLLLVAYLYADLQSIQASNWDAMGQLEHSCLRGYEEDIGAQIVQWAATSVIELHAELGSIPNSDDEDGGDLEGAPQEPVRGDSWGTAEPAGLAGTSSAVIGSSRGTSRKAASRQTSADTTAADQVYMAALQEVPDDLERLKRIRAEAERRPAGKGEERKQLAIEKFNRQKEATSINQELRTASRQRNLEQYGSKVKPRAPQPPRMTTLPELEPIAAPLPPAPADDTPPAVTATRKRRRKPVEVQDLAHVPEAVVAPQRRAPVPRTKATKRKRTVGGGVRQAAQKLPVNKRPKASTRKQVEEPDAELTEDEEPAELEPLPAASSRASAAEPAPVGDEMPELDDVADPDSDPDRPETYVPRPTKRPRATTQSTVTAGATPPASPPAKKPPTKRQRVEVLLNHLSSVPSTGPITTPNAPKHKPRPRPVFKPGTAAAKFQSRKRGTQQGAVSNVASAPQSGNRSVWSHNGPNPSSSATSPSGGASVCDNVRNRTQKVMILPYLHPYVLSSKAQYMLASIPGPFVDGAFGTSLRQAVALISFPPQRQLRLMLRSECSQLRGRRLRGRAELSPPTFLICMQNSFGSKCKTAFASRNTMESQNSSWEYAAEAMIEGVAEMSLLPDRATSQEFEWKLIASRINEIVLALKPEMEANLYGLESDGYERILLNFGMHTEQAQIKQLSGLLAIEGIPPAPELVDLYKRFCDPSDRGVQLIYEIAYENRPLFKDDEGDTITMTDELWIIFRWFRIHLGLAVAANKSDVVEWYHNKEDRLHGSHPTVEAHFAAELYLRLERWELLSMGEDPALIGELQALIAGINGLRDTNREFLDGLQGEVSRREIDLVCVYLREHPSVGIPQRLRADIETYMGSTGAAEAILKELRAIRGLRGGEEAPAAMRSA